MNLNQKNADIFIPDSAECSRALARTTHLAIGAHQDDLEIFAYHGIAECFGQSDSWFTGVTVTNGAGSSRTGIYKNYTDEEIVRVRRQEQRKAAYIGEYSAQFQLDYPSSIIKSGAAAGPAVDDLFAILSAAKPETVYLHNPADKHSSHIGVLHRSIEAIRRMPVVDRPKVVYGCEVWRDLDWLLDEDKVALPVSKYSNLASALIGVFDSQITGGKRYDLATAGRRLANATYGDAYSADNESGITWALDLTPLVQDDALSPEDYIVQFCDRFKKDVVSRINEMK